MALSPISVSPSLLRPLPTAPRAGDGLSPTKVADPETLAKIKKTAQDFEASYLSNALASMFAGVETSDPFGGGEGEAAFKSFLTEAYAKQVSRAGGVGLAAAVQKEMLKMQGLTLEPNP